MCKSEKNRMDDKQTLFENATVDYEQALNLELAADIAVEIACTGAIFSVGFATPACIAALSSLAAAEANAQAAADKMDNAAEAYAKAIDDYAECYAQLASDAIDRAEDILNG